MLRPAAQHDSGALDATGTTVMTGIGTAASTDDDGAPTSEFLAWGDVTGFALSSLHEP